MSFLLTQPTKKYTDSAPTSSGSSDSKNHNSTNNPPTYLRILVLGVCIAEQSTAFSSRVPIEEHVDKHEVYSCGLNIKGQLGHGHFDNLNAPKLVAALLPYGTKNNKSLTPSLAKPAKSPII